MTIYVIKNMKGVAMSENNNKTGTLVLVGIVLLVALAGLAYLGMNKEGMPLTPPAPVPVEEAIVPPAPEGTVPPVVEGAPPQPDSQENVVTETKKLDIPAEPEAEAAPLAPSNPDLEAMMAPRTLGSDAAPIKVVEYSSLTCGHCASFHKNDLPKIQQAYIDTGKVQFIFKEFPLNEPAIVASQILRCMPADKYAGFMSLLFDQQENWAYKPDYMAPLTQNAKLAGMTDEQIAACIGNTDLKTRLVADMQAASEKYEIQSTPTFIVNDGAKVIVGHQPFSFFEETFMELLPKDAAPVSAPAPAPVSEPIPAPEAPAAN
jgi:protein-disulfide isomerase